MEGERSYKEWQLKTRKNVKDYFNHATVHGLSRISRSGNWYVKLAWGVIVFSFLFGSVVTCYNILNEFLKSEAYLIHKYQKARSLTFPSVTVCNANNYQASKINKYFDNKDFLNYMVYESLKNNMFIPSATYGAFWAYGAQNMTFMKETRSGSDTLFANEMDGWCTFQTFINCTKKDFIDSFYHSYLGMCKTFNRDGKYLQRAPGPLSGLTMKLFINQEDYASMIPFDMGAGAILIVHPPNLFPDPLVDAVLLQPGTLTRISLTRQIYKRLPSPFPSRCADGVDDYLFPGLYTSKNCEQSCLQHELHAQCGVLDAAVTFNLRQKGMKVPYVINNNVTAEQTACAMLFYNLILNGEIKCDCPLPCSEETLKTKTSSSKWPSKADMAYYRPVLAQILNKTKVSEQFVSDNLLSVQIFFDSMDYLEMTEVPAISEASIFASIGGAIGLFLGASCYSIVEFFAFVLKSIIDCSKSSGLRQSTRVVSLKRDAIT